MIDHQTRMLAVNLQSAIATYNETMIRASLNAISVKLGGNEIPDEWPSTLQVAYLLALVIQHIPAGLVSIKRDMPAIHVAGESVPIPGLPEAGA